MQSRIDQLWQAWQRFWFAPVPLINLAVFRILLAGTMAAMYISRQFDVSLFYTDQGILPKALSLRVLPEAYRPFGILSFWSDPWVPWVHGFFVVLLLCLCLGIGGRLVALIAVFLHLAFVHRNYGIAFGADQVGGIFLIYLAFTRSQSRLSVRSLFHLKERPEFQSDLLTSVFYRMVQIQLCVIYAYSGMEKLKGQTWWDGTALWSIFANPQMVIGDFLWLRHFPLLIVFLSFSTLLFEIYFPALVWVKAMKKPMLIAGLLFHAGIGIFMALWSFSLVMIAPYVLFLAPESVESILSSVKNLMKSRLQKPVSN
jgi:hypothetical protein